MLLSKETYWLALSWAAVLVGARWLEQRAEPGARPTPRQVAASIIALAATLLVVVTPLKIVYPLSQGDWRAGTEQMRETRAWVAFRPSDPTSSGYRLAARGYPVTAVAADPRWYEVSLKSLYGYFGHLTVPLPDWVYGLALAIFASNVLVTLGVAVRRWSRLDLTTKAMIVSAPACILLAVAASVYNSWAADVQPQGRYFFVALVPLAMLLAGTLHVEGRRTIAVRVLSGIAAYALCSYALVGFAL